MPRFRKKPVEIEALQFTGTGNSCTEVLAFLGGSNSGNQRWNSTTNTGGVILTLEGEMAFSPGDWIIKGVKGEFYPCKPDIFDETYESAAGPAPAIDRAAVLSDAERQFLTFALDQAADEMSLGDGFTDEDQAALDRLRRMADEAQQPATEGMAERIAAKRQEEPFVQLAEAWSSNGPLLDDETQQGETQPDTPRCAHCTHPKGDHSDRKDHTPSRVVPRRPWCHACDAVCDYDGPPANEAQQPEHGDMESN